MLKRNYKTTTIVSEDIELSSYKKIFFFKKIVLDFKDFKHKILLNILNQSPKIISNTYCFAFRQDEDSYLIYEDESLDDLLRNALGSEEYKSFRDRFNFAISNFKIVSKPPAIFFKPPEIFSAHGAIIDKKNNSLIYFNKMNEKEAEKIFKFLLKEKLI